MYGVLISQVLQEKAVKAEETVNLILDIDGKKESFYPFLREDGSIFFYKPEKNGIFRSGFANIANGISSIFTDNPKLLLLFVMVICPGIMNLIQVWIQDNILKKQKTNNLEINRSLINNMVTDGIGDNEL